MPMPIRLSQRIREGPCKDIEARTDHRIRKHWRTMQEANRLVREFCGTDSRLHYIDVVPALLDDAGNPRLDVFRWDGLHYNEKGYAIWTSIIRPLFS